MLPHGPDGASFAGLRGDSKAPFDCRIFDHPAMPRWVVEYIVYHEMLHLKHPVRLRGSRRCVHSAEFQAEERLFPRAGEAEGFLKRM